ncbi:MAG TPA: hypothetical protein VGX78_17295 [Pirellulales bacterium]|nr:hypothetical protein [Pirellulales bacterium]
MPIGQDLVSQTNPAVALPPLAKAASTLGLPSLCGGQAGRLHHNAESG